MPREHLERVIGAELHETGKLGDPGILAWLHAVGRSPDGVVTVDAVE